MSTRVSKSKRQRLPNKLSALILVALADLAKAERSPKYKVEMDSGWHTPNHQCSICFAGAVMAFSLGAKRDEDLLPMDFPAADRRKLVALNQARSGWFGIAADTLAIGTYSRGRDATSSASSLPTYKCDPTGFKKAMRLAAKKLAAVGL